MELYYPAYRRPRIVQSENTFDVGLQVALFGHASQFEIKMNAFVVKDDDSEVAVRPLHSE